MNEEVRIRHDGEGGRAFSSQLLTLSNRSPEKVLEWLETSPAGLSEEQVEARRERYGANEVAHEKPPGWYEQLFHAFLTPFNGVLFVVSVVSLFTDVIFAPPEDRSYRTIVVLSAMVLLEPATVVRLIGAVGGCVSATEPAALNATSCMIQPALGAMGAVAV